MAGKKSRKQLVTTFQQGAKPSGADFYDFIESVININDDGIERPAGTDQPLTISDKGTNGNLLDFQMDKQLTWRINQKPEGAANPGLNFETSAEESKLFIESASGNVGIGTPTPAHKLEVNGDTNLKGDLYIDGSIYFKSMNRQMLNLWTKQLGIGIQGATQYFRTSENFAWYREGVHNDGRLNPGGGTPLMVITNDNVGIGTTEPAHKLDVNGDVGYTGKLNRLDVADYAGATVGAHDFWFGHSTRRGEPGRALVDNGPTLELNYANDWPGGVITGKLTVDSIDFNQNTQQKLNLWTAQYGIGVQGATQYFRTSSNFGFYKGGIHDDGPLNPGAGGKTLLEIKDDWEGNATTINVPGDGKRMHITGGERLYLLNKDGVFISNAWGGNGNLTVDGPFVANGDARFAGNLSAGGSINFGGQGGQVLNLYDTSYGIGIQANTQYFRTGAYFAWYRGGSHAGGSLEPGKGGVPLMVIKDDCVGIGTTTPAHKLDVSGDACFTGNLSIGEEGSINFAGEGRQMLNLWRSNYGIGIQSYTQYFRSDKNFAWYQGGAHDNGEVNPGDGGIELMRLQNYRNGEVNETLISTPNRMYINGGERLYLLHKDGVFITGDWGGNGNLTVTGLFQNSSRKLKENISSFSVKEALRIFKQLNPVKFNLKNDDKKELRLGFIAEDTPDQVASEKKDAVNINHIVTVLTKVVQDQQSKISELQDKMNAINSLNTI